MPRNLDVSAIRSFLTVAEMGAVTRAATQLNLTQSAVSLQIKRLEEALGQSLFERNGRGVTLTAAGEQLIGYSRRLLAANDETWERMKAAPATGEINLGSPDDLLHPHVPNVMRDFAGSHPKVKVTLHSAQTVFLKERLARGELDVILTTEPDLYPGGETLAARPLVWIGAPGGQAWKRRPFPLGTVAGCIFNKPAIESLSAAGFNWTVAVELGLEPGDGRKPRGRQGGAPPNARERQPAGRGDPARRRSAAAARLLREHVLDPGPAPPLGRAAG